MLKEEHLQITTIKKIQKPLVEEVLPDLTVPVEPLLVLLVTPFPKYSSITENPSFELLTFEFCSKLLFISITDLY